MVLALAQFRKPIKTKLVPKALSAPGNDCDTFILLFIFNIKNIEFFFKKFLLLFFFFFFFAYLFNIHYWHSKKPGMPEEILLSAFFVEKEP